jgi:hypothetical protein
VRGTGGREGGREGRKEGRKEVREGRKEVREGRKEVRETGRNGRKGGRTEVKGREEEKGERGRMHLVFLGSVRDGAYLHKQPGKGRTKRGERVARDGVKEGKQWRHGKMEKERNTEMEKWEKWEKCENGKMEEGGKGGKAAAMAPERLFPFPFCIPAQVPLSVLSVPSLFRSAYFLPCPNLPSFPSLPFLRPPSFLPSFRFVCPFFVSFCLLSSLS